MNKIRLSKLCGISRQTVYNLLNDGLSEEEILMKYVEPKEFIKLMEELKKEGETEFNSKHNQKLSTTKEQLKKAENQLNNTIKDLKTIKEIVKKVVLDNQRSNSIDFTFNDVNEIYEIVKDY